MRRLSDILKAALVPGLLTVFAHTLCAEHFNIQADDPAMIKQEDTYYLFCTGEGISVFSSKDMKKWESRKPVFAEAPAWAARLYPKSGNTELAPDISLHNGTYYLYYAVSTPGANNSTIAVATNRTLQPESPDFKWVDHGPIVESLAGRDMWNAIYPNLAFDDQGTPWLALGSVVTPSEEDAEEPKAILTVCGWPASCVWGFTRAPVATTRSSTTGAALTGR